MLHPLRALGSLLLLAGLAVFLVAQEDGCGSDENGGNGEGYSEEDAEYKLAVTDKGGFVPTDDPSINAYANLLDRLDTKCEEGRSLIADQAFTAAQLLTDDGISTTALQALRGMDGSIPSGSSGFNCAEISAAWVFLQVSQ